MAAPKLPSNLESRPPIAPEVKHERVGRNLARLEMDLWSGALRFESRPRIVDVQFSNFCNMACTMCYPDGNPPLQRMPPALIETLAKEAFPAASVLVPFSGSEPLIYTWELTRKLAELFRLELDIVTNVQFLDEKTFHELEPLVSSIRFSIDSHLRDVYEKIRRKSKPDVVFANLATAARLCREHSIEVQVNIVFMAENAPHLDQTIAALADLGIPTFNVLQYHYSGSAGAASDPSRHYSKAWIEELFERIRKVAREKRLRVVLDLKEKEFIDHRPESVRFRPNVKHDPWIEVLRRYLPGYCTQSVNRIKVNADGSVYPCCVADAGQLSLGNLNTRTFEEVWNGPEAQDLRRAMLTQDLPPLCQGCSFTSGWMLPEQEDMAFVFDCESKQIGAAHPLAVDPEFRIQSPAHAFRASEPPELRWSAPSRPADRFLIVLVAGGEVRLGADRFEIPGWQRSFTIPADSWAQLKANVGWWWTVWAIDRRKPERSRRAATIRALIRHQAIPRVEGSTLYSATEPLYKFSTAGK